VGWKTAWFKRFWKPQHLPQSFLPQWSEFSGLVERNGVSGVSVALFVGAVGQLP